MSVHRGPFSVHALSTSFLIVLLVFSFTQTVQFQMIYVSCQLKFNQPLVSFLLLCINVLLSTRSIAAVPRILGISSN